MNNDLLRKYAKLAVKTGVNIQNGDTLVINSPIETAEFARLITEEAYKSGAKDVVVHYGDQQLTKIKLENSSIETISNVPEWFGESYNYYSRIGACFISICESILAFLALLALSVEVARAADCLCKFLISLDKLLTSELY